MLVSQIRLSKHQTKPGTRLGLNNCQIIRSELKLRIAEQQPRVYYPVACCYLTAEPQLVKCVKG